MALVISSPSIAELSKATNLPYASVYKFLKRLVDAGIIVETRGINRRKSHYVLTETGEEVVEQIKKMLLQEFKEKHALDKNTYFIEENYFARAIRGLGLDENKLIKFLGAEYEEIKIEYSTKRGYVISL